MLTGSAIVDTTQVALLAVKIVATGPGTGVDITGYVGALEVKLGIADITGTATPTMQVTIETSDTLGSGYVTAKQADATNAVFAAKTVAGIDRMFLNAANLKRYVRTNITTLSGSSPTFATVCTLTGWKQ
jgi:hypothetical protein